MNLQVQGERILVKQDERKEKTDGGIYLSEGSGKRPSMGTIVAVGNGRTVKELMNVGDRIMFDQYAGVEIDIDEVQYKVLMYHDVLLTMEK